MYNPSADGLALTLKGTLNFIFDYYYIPLGSYVRLCEIILFAFLPYCGFKWVIMS